MKLKSPRRRIRHKGDHLTARTWNLACVAVRVAGVFPTTSGGRRERHMGAGVDPHIRRDPGADLCSVLIWLGAVGAVRLVPHVVLC
jgi:hypothetical protein